MEGAGWSSDGGYGPIVVVTDGGLHISHGLEHPPQSYHEISLFWSTGSMQNPFFSPLLHSVLFIASTIFKCIYILIYVCLTGSV